MHAVSVILGPRTCPLCQNYRTRAAHTPRDTRACVVAAGAFEQPLQAPSAKVSLFGPTANESESDGGSQEGSQVGAGFDHGGKMLAVSPAFLKNQQWCLSFGSYPKTTRKAKGEDRSEARAADWLRECASSKKLSFSQCFLLRQLPYGEALLTGGVELAQRKSAELAAPNEPKPIEPYAGLVEQLNVAGAHAKVKNAEVKTQVKEFIGSHKDAGSKAVLKKAKSKVGTSVSPPNNRLSSRACYYCWPRRELFQRGLELEIWPKHLIAGQSFNNHVITGLKNGKCSKSSAVCPRTRPRYQDLGVIHLEHVTRLNDADFPRSVCTSTTHVRLPYHGR